MSTSIKPYIVAGCKATGETHPRLEIRGLIQKPYQFSLFVRALTAMQEAKYQPNPASFREIGGIHGLPYKVWSGDMSEKPLTDDSEASQDPEQWLGYCYHATILFPTWHRVLIMLIEQAVSEAAQKIALEDEKVCEPVDKGKWFQAAKELRFQNQCIIFNVKFWDWTNPETAKQGLPVVADRSIFGEETIPILDPASKQWKEAQNPLYTYRFGEQIPAGFVDSPPSYYAEWKRTYRWPTDSQTDPKEQYDLLDKTFSPDGYQGDQGFTWLNTKIKMLFNVPPNLPQEDWPSLWDRFSNTSPQEGRVGNIYSGPLGEPHNQVHNNIGGSGNMSDPEYAGFDPIFYLHHCNIDRILAFWEAVYPNYWMGKGWYDSNNDLQSFIGTQGTLVQLEGTQIGEDSDLAPFRQSETKYWASKDVRFFNKNAAVNKYYTYEDIDSVSVNEVLTSEQRVEAILKLQSYFDPDSKVRALPFDKLPPIFSPPNYNGRKGVPDSTTPVERFRHFIIQGDLDPNAFNGSYILEILLTHTLGDIPANTVVDKISVFVRKDPSRCANCAYRSAIGARFNGVIVIPSTLIIALVHDHHLDDSDKEGDEADAEFLGHLKGVFSARIIRPDGTLLAERPVVGDGAVDEQSGEWWPKLTLLSAAASTSKEIDSETPTAQFFLHDWKNHDGLLENGWQKT